MAEVVRAGVQLNDGASPVLKGMVSSVRGVIAAFDQMDKGVAKGIDVKSLRRADNELLKIQNHLNPKGAAGAAGGGGVFGGVTGGATGASGALGAFGKLGGAITVANQGLQLLEATAGRALGVVEDAVGSVLSMGMDRAGAIEGAESTLEGLHHSADEIDEIMEAARQSVLGTFFDLGAAGKVASSAVAAGVKPGQDLERYLTLVADAASIAKVDMSEMGGVFNKVAAGEKMTAYELNQLTDKGIPALSLLAKSMGTTSGAVRDMVSAGEIGIEELQDAIELGMGGAAKAVDTFEAGIANSEAALGRLGAGFLAPLRDSGKEVLAEVIPMIDQFTALMEPAFSGFAGAVGPEVQEMVSDLEPLIPVLAEVSSNGLELAQVFITNLLPYIPPLADLVLSLTDAFMEMLLPLMENKDAYHDMSLILAGVLFGAMVAIMTIVTALISAYHGVAAAVYDVIAAKRFLTGDTDGAAQALEKAKNHTETAKQAWIDYAGSVGAATNALVEYNNTPIYSKTPRSGGEHGALDAHTKTPGAAGGSTTGGVAEGPATKQTAANTKSAADSLARSKEDLKYLRDVATRKAINRFTTAKIDLKFTANNTIKGKQDVDGVNNSIWDTLVRATNAMAEA